MTTMADDVIEIRDYLLAERDRQVRKVRDCLRSKRGAIGEPGLPFAAAGIADFLFGGWGRYFTDAPVFREGGTGSGLDGKNFRRPRG
jgi:hypothetical protein